MNWWTFKRSSLSRPLKDSINAFSTGFPDGRPFQALIVVDQWSCQSPILNAASSMSGATVGMDRILVSGSAPRSVTVDHGTEFMSRALEGWAYQRGVQLDFMGPARRMRLMSRTSRTSTPARPLGRPLEKR